MWKYIYIFLILQEVIARRIVCCKDQVYKQGVRQKNRVTCVCVYWCKHDAYRWIIYNAYDTHCVISERDKYGREKHAQHHYNPNIHRPQNCDKYSKKPKQYGKRFLGTTNLSFLGSKYYFCSAGQSKTPGGLPRTPPGIFREFSGVVFRFCTVVVYMIVHIASSWDMMTVLPKIYVFYCWWSVLGCWLRVLGKTLGSFRPLGMLWLEKTLQGEWAAYNITAPLT